MILYNSFKMPGMLEVVLDLNVRAVPDASD